MPAAGLSAPLRSIAPRARIERPAMADSATGVAVSAGQRAQGLAGSCPLAALQACSPDRIPAQAGVYARTTNASAKVARKPNACVVVMIQNPGGLPKRRILPPRAGAAPVARPSSSTAKYATPRNISTGPTG